MEDLTQSMQMVYCFSTQIKSDGAKLVNSSIKIKIRKSCVYSQIYRRQFIYSRNKSEMAQRWLMEREFFVFILYNMNFSLFKFHFFCETKWNNVHVFDLLLERVNESVHKL